MQKASSYVLYPVLKIQQCIVEPCNRYYSERKNSAYLQEQYILLQDEYQQLLAENIALKAMCCYADDIAECVQFKKRYDIKKARIAHVLARHISDQNQFFLVDAGMRDGITKDMVVLYNNCLVGKIVDVYPWYCKVSLITDNECKVAALCTQTRVSGILEGNNNATMMTLQYVSHLENIQEGDTLVSSGDGFIFPNGFGLGTIITAQKSGLFYTITVKSLLDFSSLRYCIIVAKNEIE